MNNKSIVNIVSIILYGIIAVAVMAIVAVMVMILGIFFSGWALTMLSAAFIFFLGIILFNLV